MDRDQAPDELAGTLRERLVAGAAQGTLTPPLLELLACAVHARCTILGCGGTGSGKTTTLNALFSSTSCGTTSGGERFSSAPVSE
jgi:predicted GTPase